jgi:PAS domain-containing protein
MKQLRAKNVTERRLAKDALQESEARFREMAETVSSAFWTSEFDGAGRLRYVYMSPAFERIFGIPVERIYDDPQAWLKMIHPDDS